MSDMAVEGNEININDGSVLEQAEPTTTAFEAESQAQTTTEAETNEERIARLEQEAAPTYSEDYLQGFKQAAEQLGALVEVEPGQPGYVEYAQQEFQRLTEENAQIIQALAQAGGDEYLQYAAELLDNFNAGIEQRTYEAQLEAEQRAAEWENAVSTGQELIGQWVNETADLVGVDAESVDTERVWSIAENAYGALIEQYGQEVANQLVPELIQKTVAHVSDESEAGMQQAYETAEKLAKDLGGKADPMEVTRIASDVYQRALYRAGGDQTEALRASMLEAAKTAAGFSDKSQPLNMSVASLHATINKSIPREAAPQPKLEVKLDRPRDAKTGRFTVKPLAETYNRAAQEKAAKLQGTQAQRDAIKAAFAYYGGNANS